MTGYYARSASDNADDWPFWFVADAKRGGLNVTATVMDEIGITRNPGQTLLGPWEAVKVAMAANRTLPA